MLKKVIPLIVLTIALAFMGCNSESAQATGEQYGQGVTLAEAMPINDVFAKADELNGQVVRVSGTISDLCKHKGCWMQVKSDDQVLTVRFKDEAFTLPADAAGRQVDFEGLLIAEKISNPLGEHSACAEGGEHKDGEACENDRAGKAALENAVDMRYTMVSTGLVLL